MNELNEMNFKPLYHCFGSVVGSLMTTTKSETLVLPASVHNPIQTQSYR